MPPEILLAVLQVAAHVTAWDTRASADAELRVRREADQTRLEINRLQRLLTDLDRRVYDESIEWDVERAARLDFVTGGGAA